MTDVAFGIFDHIDYRPAPLAQIYEERLQLLEAADAAGFSAFHLAEHHATPLSVVPSPGIFLAAATQRTRRIRLGPLVFLLPLYNPLRLLNEICMLDHLSRGRLDLGVGRGVSPFELDYFGVSPLRSREMFQEALDILVAGFTHDRLSYKGDYYQYRNVPIELHPLQQPYPPLWYPTSRRDSVSYAARQGMSTVLAGSPEMIKDRVALYWEVWQQHRDDSERLNAQVAVPRIGVNLKVYVAESDDEAVATARPAQRMHHDRLIKLWQDFNTLPTGFTGDLDAMLTRHGALVGSPAHVREEVAYWLEATGCNYLVCHFHFGDLTHQQALRSLRLFAEEVMPAFVTAVRREA
jgi:alkanesulfonate monooxygenase SsuD/methylene tetrahydromethanopterin reductase-like flavin-dependent oxidoreductase (luciferase family)